MKIAKLFESLDIFGKKVGLTIEGNNSMKTKFGSFLTLIFMILLGLIIYLNSVELFKRKNPISYEQTKVTSDHKAIIINQTSFLFKFNYSDGNGNYVNITNYFEYDVTYHEYIFDYSLNYLVLRNTTIFPLVQCPDINGTSDYNLCFKENQNIHLEGYWDQSVLKFFRLNFYTCDTEKNKQCRSLDEIFEFSGDKLFGPSFYFNRNTIQVSNYTSPIDKNVYISYKLFTNQQKITTFFIKTDSLITDNGFLTENIETQSFFNVQELQTDSAPYGRDSRLIYCAVFYASNVSNITRRSYIKIQDIFAKVGGIANVIFFIFKYFNSSISKIKMNEKIMNSIYSEELCKNEKLDPFGLSLINEKSKNNLIEKNEKNKNSKLKSVFYEKKLTKILNIKISVCEIIRLLFSNCKKPKKKKFLNYFNHEERLSFYQDIINVIKKLEEFEIIKALVMKEKDLQLLNIILPNPYKFLDVPQESKEFQSKEFEINRGKINNFGKTNMNNYLT